MLRITAYCAVSALGLSLAATSAQAGSGGGGLATGLFFGALGGQLIEQGAQAQRRKAYEAEQIRRERAAAARRAAAAQQARAAEYQRAQRAKAQAAAAEEAAKEEPKVEPKVEARAATSDLETASATQDKTTTVTKIDTPLSASSADAHTCRKYSAAVGGMVDTPCQ